MDLHVLAVCLLIIAARLVDVSLGTIRTICVVQGRAVTAWALGFFEVLVWIFAVSQVIQNLQTPLYAVAYAFGFASGNFVGIMIERRLAFGRQVVRIFTRAVGEMPQVLREHGYKVTKFAGYGRDGAVDMLFIETHRRETPRVIEHAVAEDPHCFYLVDDIRLAASPGTLRQRSTGWRGILKRK